MAILRWRQADQSMDCWEPFQDLSEIQSEMNRLFSGFFGRPASGTTVDRVWTPAMDMYETKDELVVTAELPGVDEKAINLTITGDVLTLRGERVARQEAAGEGSYRGERWFGRFERSLALPIPVQADKVKATYRDGVLAITLPKVEEIKPKEIKIEVL